MTGCVSTSITWRQLLGRMSHLDHLPETQIPATVACNDGYQLVHHPRRCLTALDDVFAFGVGTPSEVLRIRNVRLIEQLVVSELGHERQVIRHSA